MTTFTSISNAALAVGGIPSSATVTALRDNVPATAEASSGAPVIAAGWHPTTKVNVGDTATGLIYDFAVNGATTAIVTPDFEDGYEYRLAVFGISHSSGTTGPFYIDLYKASTGYTTGFQVSGMASSNFLSCDVEILLPRIDSTQHFIRGVAALDNTTATVVTNLAYNATSQKVLRASVNFNGKNIDNGRVYLFRRREYASKA